MNATQTEELLHHLEAGIFDPTDVEGLERTPAADLLARLDADFPFKFQERRLRDKWEFGMARSLHYRLAAKTLKDSPFLVFIPVPVFRKCLLVSGEGDAITSVAVVSRLAVTPIRKPFKGYVLSSGVGFNLFKPPDGWAIKPTEKRAVKVTRDFLIKKGWQFDKLQPFSREP